MDIEREDPNSIRLTPHDAGVVGSVLHNCFIYFTYFILNYETTPNP
jgi:hypothetical protein